jgi:hypothetical protein
MLHKCANPGCAIRFRHLRRGKLFQIESEYFEAPESGPPIASGRKVRPLRRVERYWLCDQCASCLTLTFDQSRGVVTVPLPDAAGQRIMTAMHLQELQSSTALARAGQGSR